jgi:hypothetical protein
MLFYQMALPRHTITSTEVTPQSEIRYTERQGEGMSHTTSLRQQSREKAPGYYSSVLSNHEIVQWGLLIALPLVGMPLLVLCFLLQGVFAVLGPLAIFVGVKLLTKRLETTPTTAGGVRSKARF